MQDYPRLRAVILREANRQVVAPLSLLRLRVYQYYNLNRPANRGGVDLLWFKLFYAIKRAVRERLLREAPARPHGPWLYPSDREDEALAALDRRVGLYEDWRNRLSGRSGSHGPALVREALRRARFAVAPGPVRMQYEGEEWEIDVLTLAPLRLAIEVKNKLSESYHSPEVTSFAGEDLEQIQQHFRLAHSINLVPMLVASLVDRSFHSFQRRFGGLHYRMLFQYVPSNEAEACETIRREFRFGHVRATDEPPRWMQDWFRRLPTLHATTYGSPSS